VVDISGWVFTSRRRDLSVTSSPEKKTGPRKVTWQSEKVTWDGQASAEARESRRGKKPEGVSRRGSGFVVCGSNTYARSRLRYYTAETGRDAESGPGAFLCVPSRLWGPEKGAWVDS